jgi:predicted RNase H-like nuclease
VSRGNRDRAGATPTRFLGVDLAWGRDNASGVVALAGHAFPLRLSSAADVVPDHAAASAWIAAQADGGPTAVGIDAPLLGLGAARRRRPCDDLVSSAFGRFHASTHSPPRAPDPRRFTDRLRRRYGATSLAPGVLPTRARPAIREVYPNALQVLLFGLDRPGSAIMPYKLRRFGQRHLWVTRGLRPFIARCRYALEAEYVDRRAPGWRALVALTPRVTMAHAELKAIEDRWDAVLCALAVAFEHLAPDTMRAYAGAGAAGWRRGYILAPALPIRRGGQGTIDPAGRPAGLCAPRPRRVGPGARRPLGSGPSPPW